MSLHFLVNSTRTHLHRVLPSTSHFTSRRSCDLSYIDLKGASGPFEVFEDWMEEAKTCGVSSPLIGNVATATKSGRVSNRTIAMIDYVDRTFVYLFGINTRKFADLYENPTTSVTFWWRYADAEGHQITRQVRAVGCVERLDEEIARKYFCALPLYAQLRSVLSEFPGRPIEWEKLKERHDEILREVEEGTTKLGLPKHLIACRIIPVRFDFYFGHDDFVPDRVIFKFTRDKKWLCRRVIA